MTPPTLTTERLVLRPMTMADFPKYRDFVTSDRTQYMSGPHDAATAWHWFCADVAQWALLDMGALIVTHQGRVVGTVGVCGGPIFPEPELGRFLFDGADEGQGFATEAAAAMRDWALGPRGLASVVAYVDAGNAASVRVADRLGGVLTSVPRRRKAWTRRSTGSGGRNDATRHRHPRRCSVERPPRQH